MDPRQVEIDRILTMTEGDLYAEIGLGLAGRSMLPLQRGKLIHLAKDWCGTVLAPAICGNERMRAIGRQDLPTQEAILLVCGVLELMGHLTAHLPAPSITVAALVTRVGLHRICSEHWEAAGVPEPDPPEPSA